MNTANLQLEGLYLAIAAVNNALVEKGALSREELSIALRRAEETALGDYRSEELSSAQRDAMAFPARLLLMAHNTPPTGLRHPSPSSPKWSGRPRNLITTRCNRDRKTHRYRVQAAMISAMSAVSTCIPKRSW